MTGLHETPAFKAFDAMLSNLRRVNTMSGVLPALLSGLCDVYGREEVKRALEDL